MLRTRTLAAALGLIALSIPLRASAARTTPYATTTGSPAAAGTRADPVDLVTGFSRLAPGDTLRITTGDYIWDKAVSGEIPILSGVTIDGGYVDVAGVWSKNLATRTEIHIEPKLL